jgi:hypothetical protein
MAPTPVVDVPQTPPPVTLGGTYTIQVKILQTSNDSLLIT